MSKAGSSALREQRVEGDSTEPPSWPTPYPIATSYPCFHEDFTFVVFTRTR